MNWIYYKTFTDLTPEHLYAILKLRQDVFIIEQDCIYDDIDGLDQHSAHLLGIIDDQLAGYARIVPAGKKFREVSVGRIVVHRDYRNQGIGRILVQKSLQLLKEKGNRSVRIEAQAHLEKYYTSLGFRKVSDVYEVDGIPHIQMVCEL